jgi:hypothetical protein
VVRASVAVAAASAVDRAGAVSRPLCAGCVARIRARGVAELEGEQHPWLAYQLSDKNYRAPESEKNCAG